MVPAEHSLDEIGELTPEYLPETIVNRQYEYAAIQNALASSHPQNIFIHGKRGTGKTLLTRRVIREQATAQSICYIRCTKIDTQYQVLRRIFHRLTGKEIGQGYHTAQLKRRIREHISDQRLVVVLDDIEFLLENDGDDLLYYLSRTRHADNLTVVGISSNHADPASIIEARTLSTFQPSTITFEPYSEAEIVQILEHRLQEAQLQTRVEDAAVKQIAKRTANVKLALHWLSDAAASGPEQITWEYLRTVRRSAAQRYRTSLLQGFTPHHQALLSSIDQLEIESGDDAIVTGTVYERYQEICQDGELNPLTPRRVGDFITHLRLLNIINVENIPGGETGRTREISLREPL